MAMRSGTDPTAMPSTTLGLASWVAWPVTKPRRSLMTVTGTPSKATLAMCSRSSSL